MPHQVTEKDDLIPVLACILFDSARPLSTVEIWHLACQQWRDQLLSFMPPYTVTASALREAGDRGHVIERLSKRAGPQYYKLNEGFRQNLLVDGCVPNDGIFPTEEG